MSLGHDAAGRSRALQEAMAAGRLPGGLDALTMDMREQLALPAPRADSVLALPAPEQGETQGLSPKAAEALAKLARLRDQMANTLPRAQRLQRIRARQDLRQTKTLKAKTAARVAAYIGGGSQ